MGALVAASVAVFLVMNLAVSEFTPEDPPDTAAAPDDLPPEWAFVRPAMDELRSVAIQACTQELAVRIAPEAERAREEAHLASIVREYDKLMVNYNERLGETYRAGNRRPWEVPATAPPIEVTQKRACLQAAAMPVRDDQPLARTAPSGEHVANPAPLDGSRFLTLEQLDQAAIEAGWPMEPGWWPEMRKIIQCETGSLDTMAHNTSDPHGGSYGLAQLNGSYHFENAGEDFAMRFDPVVNLRTALWLRTIRGHFGGTGGWYNCANKWGIP